MNSFQQSGILEALSQPWEGRTYMPASEILRRLGNERPTASQRVSLTRSLTRLARRGLVVRYHAEICRQGNGYLWELNRQ
jgi:DNA-binding MarR family transcriptional regulator